MTERKRLPPDESARICKNWQDFNMAGGVRSFSEYTPYIDFKELERIHKEWERYDLDGRYRVVPNDPKGPMLKYVPGKTEFDSGCTITIRSSRESADE